MNRERSFHKSLLIFFLALCVCSFIYSGEFPAGEYAERRNKLKEKIGNAVAVITSAPVYIRNGDVEYEYRQGSNFYYLTGFEEPKSAALIDGLSGRFILFVQPKNPALEIWTGEIYGIEKTKEKFGADECYDISEFDSFLSSLNKRKIYYPKSDNELSKKIPVESEGYDLNPLIAEMRLIKSEYEIAQLKKAIDITSSALIETMRQATPGIYEYELQAIVEYNFRMGGSKRNGFPSIVGSGKNSCILHYTSNNRKTEDGDIVLMDVGAEYNYYTADITRTFPVNGRFSEEQRIIYEIVLKAQKEAINIIKPGARFYQIDSVARAVIKNELVGLGLLKPDENVMKFFMHGTSHWVGLDVHDAGSYDSPDGIRRGQILRPGMVLAVEPGIYISENSGVDKKWHNIGVRIEDDVLVTENGCEVLSSALPREATEIEKIMKR
ncbi:MAG: aminopeptidase P N-terminal domain-containing protein [Ignavibacteria bacterium]|nr:aminopeptidase P N-terminal domain-containing protein [Ignavibacteria bacterium]